MGVGASAAISTINSEVKATLGDMRYVTAGAMSVVAELRNDIDSVSVAGSDPLARRDGVYQQTPELGGASTLPQNNTTEKDISVDASVALAMIDNVVHACIGSKTRLTLSGGDVIATDRELADASFEQTNLWLRAYQRGQTAAMASGFEVGGSAAVGAAVAVNLANSDVVLLHGRRYVTGKAIMRPHVQRDEARAGDRRRAKP